MWYVCGVDGVKGQPRKRPSLVRNGGSTRAWAAATADVEAEAAEAAAEAELDALEEEESMPAV